MAYTLTREALLLDLHAAFQCAKHKKTQKPYVRVFERDLERNLNRLADDLMDRSYKPEPSSCFIIQRPKKREVFAAQFRDRVVHHLYYNYAHQLFERTFIQDTYSCIPERGTHYGVDRLKQHIRRESHGFQRECYVMSLDIRGYFMHIDRQILAEIAVGSLQRMGHHRVSAQGRQRWEDVVDIPFLEWLTREIIMLDPKTHCQRVGSETEWVGLDPEKSLFHTREGCGLPIGNLTSQLFSNVYLNEFDQFMKRTLGCKHYGRYVDDAYVVSADKRWLLSLVPHIRQFLKERLHLDLHMGKLRIQEVHQGAEFLGAYVKPRTTYISNAAVRRLVASVDNIDTGNRERVLRSVNSFLGVLSHYDSYNIRCGLFLRPEFLRHGTFNRDMTTFTLSRW
ncbi:MAG: hypothetical protein II822_10515 [Prevotella sp.]|nr:hypothetical protein [Prevotella sp.]